MKRKNTKLLKLSKIITQQVKPTEKPNSVDIKLVIIEHPKTSHKKIQRDDETLYNTFYSNSKAEIIIMKVTLMIYLNL